MDEIKDNEIRLLSGDLSQLRNRPSQASVPEPTPKQDPKRRWWVVVLCVLATIAILTGVLIAVCHSDSAPDDLEESVYDPVLLPSEVPSHALREWFEQCEQQSLNYTYRTSLGADSVPHTDTIVTALRYTVLKDTAINDIPLRIFFPLNATPRLTIGYGLQHDTARHILFFQAADVRADNGKIVGAFVLHGKPLSFGLSKRGYCAIIDGQVTVGVADNSPLFEQATTCGGDFFRQYPLVDNGQLVENELKTKSIRRGLCEMDGRVVVVESGTVESLHDFSQALVDLGVTNAIYLIGGTSSQGYCRLSDGSHLKFGMWDARKHKNASFIVW